MDKRALLFCAVFAAATGGIAMALWSGVPGLRSRKVTTGEADEASQQPHTTARAVLAEQEADLGVVDDLSECWHVFSIRNEGTAPLQLERGRTSCKCMMSELPEKSVPPGGEAEIRIGAKSSAKRGPFRHTAYVLTNDPSQQRLALRITGITRTHLDVSPEQLSFPVMEPGESYTGEAVVYTQVWPQFEIVEVKPSLPDLTWQIEPASAEALDELEARAGYLVRVTVPPGRAPGRFQEWLGLSVNVSGDTEQERTARVKVVGDVPPPLELFGRGLVGDDRLRLEAVSAASGGRHTLTIKITDENRELSVRRIDTKPKFLKAALRPMQPDKPELGLYRLDIEVPPGSPPGNYHGESKATIRVETDHPVVPTIALDVEFAVVPQ